MELPDNIKYNTYSFSDFGSLIPIVSITFIFIGFFNLDNYYEHFGLEIYNYLDTSEVLLSFTTILSASFITVVSIIYMLAGFLPIVNSTIEENSEMPVLWKFNLKRVLISLGVFTVASGFYFFVQVINRTDKFSIVPDWQLIISITILGLSVIFAFLYGFNLFTKHLKLAIQLVAILILFFCSYSFIYVRNKRVYENILKGYHKYDVKLILTDGRNYITNDSIIYIGSTRNYYFLHNVKSKVNNVIPTSLVKESELKRN